MPAKAGLRKGLKVILMIEGRVTGKTKIAALIGNPVSHSISPQLHNTLSSLMGIDLAYVPFRVEKRELEAAVNGLKALNAAGFNVTIPFKHDVMQYIDEISEDALLYGAVNTVDIRDGRLYGYNTDADGFSRSFKEEAGCGFEGKRVVIIGAGGASRSIAAKIAGESPKKVYIANRTASTAFEIAGAIRKKIDCDIEPCSLEYIAELGIVEKSDIIINTTSVGMHPDADMSPIDESVAFSSGQIVYDIIYNPPKTAFLKRAEKFGCKTVNGFGMLFYQGVYAFEIWTGAKVPENIIRQAYSLLADSIFKIT